ncbi:hypothetical protein PoB_005950900 [Plakobranchus ocellatus]|uniref:Uncharacterized protein n=1 Tax=Plakobranchus ocellatus TaxID=259542 RepID=A0AAV4CJL1_9GAST|nr:hypothetical protein PoB_005950900 [Plakobranchus ocellatus]
MGWERLDGGEFMGASTMYDRWPLVVRDVWSGLWKSERHSVKWWPRRRARLLEMPSFDVRICRLVKETAHNSPREAKPPQP